MSGFDVRVIATDGSVLRELMYINHRGSEIAYNFRHVAGSGDEHYTYHGDGYVHQRIDLGDTKKKRPVGQGPPLDNFKGYFGVTGFHFNVDNNWGYAKPRFEFKQSDDVIYIDMRNISESLIIRPYFLEKGLSFTDVLDHPGTDVDEPLLQYHMITKTDPWMCVVYYDTTLDGWIDTSSPHFQGAGPLAPDSVDNPNGLPENFTEHLNKAQLAFIKILTNYDGWVGTGEIRLRLREDYRIDTKYPTDIDILAGQIGAKFGDDFDAIQLKWGDYEKDFKIADIYRSEVRDLLD